MPTVLRFGAFRVVIFPADHRPAHVHVTGRGHWVVFNLNCPAGPAVLRENFGMSRRELREVQDGIAGHVGMLCRRWREIHGEY
ncbi:MAG: DUF4160 domain-containing protein [Candidatus Koribacter versatilis]|uniref:DUF4160 domain-containing protein n=1 Tax=Candidatus Korobacter versatilis TaxID=658062 RepID=A0A932EP91_9BACT|nr:DUF4160 domain-containing protein [Candidatus Koribacter versatilis]